MKLKISLIVVSIIAVSVIVVSFTLNSSVRDLKVEINEMTSEVNGLKNEITILEHEKSKLTAENEVLQTEKVELNQMKATNFSDRNSSSEGVKYRTTKPIQIHSHMTKGSSVIGDIPQGRIVEVLDSFFEDHWKIKYNGIIGWVDTDSGKMAEAQAMLNMEDPPKPSLERIK